MSYQLRVRPGLLDDLAKAVDWYQERGPGLGDDFVRSFHATLARVQREPLSNLRARGEVRRVILDRFPYALWFRVDGDTVVVLLLWHTARNPTALQQALRRRKGES